MLDNLEKYTETDFGFASVKCVGVTSSYDDDDNPGWGDGVDDKMELEDYMPSYFLAETCLYLALLFSE